MRLYRILFDGEREHVEAPTFGEAIDLWRAHGVTAHDVDGSEEPESVELVDDEPVIRDADESRARDECADLKAKLLVAEERIDELGRENDKLSEKADYCASNARRSRELVNAANAEIAALREARATTATDDAERANRMAEALKRIAGQRELPAMLRELANEALAGK